MLKMTRKVRLFKHVTCIQICITKSAFVGIGIALYSLYTQTIQNSFFKHKACIQPLDIQNRYMEECRTHNSL